MPLEQTNRYFFYQSAIGDLEYLVTKNVLPDVKPTSGFLTNAFGVKVNPAHLPLVLGANEGVEPPPIPANWHADLAEFGSALYAVEAAKQKFTVVELGCGWGCWLNITGVVARRKGLEIKLIGVEGDAGHVRFAHEALQENGFTEDEYFIHHGIASAKSGSALFPIQEQAGASWGLEARFDVPDDEVRELLATGEYTKLEQIPVSTLLPPDCERIDLLHVDIQGAEIPLIPESMPFLNDRVAMVLIGTHSKHIEAALIDSFQNAGWSLDVERPAILSVGRDIHTLVDGVQLWRNPKLLPEKFMRLSSGQDYAGRMGILSAPKSVLVGEEFFVDVDITSFASKDWSGIGDEPIYASYHWRCEDGKFAVYDGERTNLKSGVIESGETVKQPVRVLAPSQRGSYKLEVTLVHESISWFGEGAFGSCVIDVAVR